MRIQHNIMAMNAYRNYNTNTSALSKNLEKLSSGYKINRAGDDAAGLAISEKMRAQITGLNAAQKNVKDGISLVKTAEGAMQEIQDMLNRMDYLATQSANGTYDDPVDRMNLQKEVDQLRSEINRIADSANFNGIKLLDGSLASANTAAWNVEAQVEAAKASNPTWTTENIDSAFGTTSTGHAWHPGAANVTQTTVSFKVDLKGMKATVSAANSTAVTFNFTIAGQSVTVGMTTSAAGENAVTAGDLAAAFNGNDFSIQGLTFTATASGSEITFTMKTGQTYGTTVANDLNSHWSEDITLNSVDVATGTDHSGSVNSAHSSVSHSAYDYSGANTTIDDSRAGIDLDLTGLVSDYSKLTINDVTFIFKTDANSAATVTDATKEILIDVSDPKFATTADREAEALRQMTDSSVNTLLDKTTATGTSTNHKEVYLSANNGKLHLDQTDTSTEIYSSADKMKALVKFERGSDTAAVAGSVSADLNKFQLGDRVNLDGETYVVAEKTDADTGDITKEDLITKMSSALTKDIDTSVYNVTTDGTTLKVTAATPGTGDSASELAKVKEQLEKNIKALAADNKEGGSLTLQIGDTSDSYNQLKVGVGNMHVYSMGTFETQQDADGNDVQVLTKSINDIDISTRDGASEAVDVIKNAINYVSSVRGDLGATQNRLEHTANNLSVMAENIQDAESTIRDTDIAEEMMSYTKNNILVQSAQAMLAQANAVPQGVLQLLG